MVGRMKLYCLMICLVVFPLALRAGEPAASSSSGQPPATQMEEKEFHDPFASEGESPKAQPKVSDPLEPMNRAFFRFNDKLYFWVLKPAAKGYNKVAPQPVRVGVKRFFTNVKFPVRFVNNLLQAKFKRAGIETARFVLNSTVGLAGFFDPAGEELKLQIQPADFDQTLAVYRIPPGIYLNWPIAGPSSVRGTVGMAGDSALTPWTYIDGIAVSLTVRPYETVNETSLKLGDYESFKKGALDPYVSLRDAYFEHRRSQIKGNGPAPVEWSARRPSAKASPSPKVIPSAHATSSAAPPPVVELSARHSALAAQPAQPTELSARHKAAE
jgi:phospholipid-binding lipoprotein MlaA